MVLGHVHVLAGLFQNGMDELEVVLVRVSVLERLQDLVMVDEFISTAGRRIVDCHFNHFLSNRSLRAFQSMIIALSKGGQSGR